MALARDDRWLADAQGRALAGAQVYYCSQPATVPADAPPSPLLTVYGDIDGTTAATQPLITDGFGHCDAYVTTGVLFTVAMYHPLFGEFPVVLPDQQVGGGGGGGSVVTPFAGVPDGVIDGVNTTFILRNGLTPLTAVPTQMEAWLNYSQIPNVGYSVGLLGGFATIVYSTPPQPGTDSAPADVIYAQGLTIV